MLMEVFIWILLIAGLVGAVVPALPGPIFSAIALAVAQYTAPSDANMWGYAALGVIIFFIDYLLPSYLTKKGGGSKQASRGALIGMLLGIFTGPGMLLSGAMGAFIGEYMVTKDGSKSLKASLFAMAGVISGIVVKVVYCAAVIVVYVIEWLL